MLIDTLMTQTSLERVYYWLYCKSGMTIGNPIFHMKIMMRSQNSRGQATLLHHKSQGEQINYKGNMNVPVIRMHLLKEIFSGV
jgi:hypothetical protein